MKQDLVELLDSKPTETIKSEIKKSCDIIFKQDNTFSHLLKSFEDVIMHIQTKKPTYPIADLVEVLKQIERLDAVKLIIESLTEAKE